MYTLSWADGSEVISIEHFLGTFKASLSDLFLQSFLLLQLQQMYLPSIGLICISLTKLVFTYGIISTMVGSPG